MIEMNTPKQVGCLNCGFQSQNVLEIEEFQDNGCPNCRNKKEFPINCQECAQPVRDCICEVYEYKGTFTFKTDQELTNEQIEQIIFALSVQIEEPTDSNGDDEEFTTREITIKLEAE